MKIGVTMKDVELFIELTTEEFEKILPLISVETKQEEESENDIPEPEEEPSDKKFKIPCRTWNHQNEEAKFKFVKNWLRRRKIPFTEEPGYTRSYITYELTLSQLERLQLGMKEAFGEDFDTEIKI